MEKGTRIEIIQGRDQGVIGTVFWTGPDKFNEGETRLGVKTDDGQTYWVNASLTEETDKTAAPQADASSPSPSPSPSPPSASAGAAAEIESDIKRGDRVQWGDHEGTVFWAGPSKFGDGIRLGIEAEDGEKHWLDAAQVTLLETGRGGGGGGSRGGDNDEEPGPPGGFDDSPPPEEWVATSAGAAPGHWDDDDPGPGAGDYGPPVEPEEPQGFDPDDIPF